MSSNDLEPISGELVREHGRTLFQTDDPVEVLDHARRMADALKTALDDGGMTMRIGRNEHVLIDGWQTLRLRCSASARTSFGRGRWPTSRETDGRRAPRRAPSTAASSARPRRWSPATSATGSTADDYAIRSMAQTRAMSKALRGPLGFVITLAGRDATPAEEVAADAPEAAQTALPAWAQDIDGEAIDRLGDNLQKIVELTGVEFSPDLVAAGVANQLGEFCDGTIPACCARLAKLLVQALDPHGPPVPPTPTTRPTPAPRTCPRRYRPMSDFQDMMRRARREAPRGRLDPRARPAHGACRRGRRAFSRQGRHDRRDDARAARRTRRPGPRPRWDHLWASESQRRRNWSRRLLASTGSPTSGREPAPRTSTTSPRTWRAGAGRRGRGQRKPRTTATASGRTSARAAPPPTTASPPTRAGLTDFKPAAGPGRRRGRRRTDP